MTPPADRLRELATEGAFVRHMRGGVGHLTAMNTSDWGFDTCSHPDCVLVRSGDAPTPLEHHQDAHGRCLPDCYACERKGLQDRVRFTADYETLKYRLAAGDAPAPAAQPPTHEVEWNPVTIPAGKKSLDISGPDRDGDVLIEVEVDRDTIPLYLKPADAMQLSAELQRRAAPASVEERTP